MSKCNKCFHPCHCEEDKSLHADIYGVCTCENCNCEKKKSEDASFENNGGLVIDDTNECEGCQ